MPWGSVASHHDDRPAPLMFGFQRRRVRQSSPDVRDQFAPADPRRLGDAGRHWVNATLFWIYTVWAAVTAVLEPSIAAGLAALVLAEVGLATIRVASVTGRVVADIRESQS
jgi:hypothetical protein